MDGAESHFSEDLGDDSANASVAEQEVITEEEAKEVLMSLIKSEYAENVPIQSTQYKQVQQAKTSTRHARGFAEKGQDKKDIAYLKKITRCNGCNQGGHWREDAICPKRGGPGGHANYYMELEDDDMDEWTETLIEDQVADE